MFWCGAITLLYIIKMSPTVGKPAPGGVAAPAPVGDRENVAPGVVSGLSCQKLKKIEKFSKIIEKSIDKVDFSML